MKEKRTPLNRKRVLTDPVFEMTRQNNAGFSRAGTVNRLLRHAFVLGLPNKADRYVSGRLTKTMIKILQSDVVNERGERRVPQGVLGILEGFNFNRDTSPQNTLKFTYSIIIDKEATLATIEFPAFIPQAMIDTTSGPVDLPAQKNAQTQGLVTGTQVRVITDPNNLSAGNWLTTVNFYDDRNRIIQVNSETHKGRDIVTNRYDFTGKLLVSYLDQSIPTGTPTSVHVKTIFAYDHSGRLMEVWKALNDNNKILIAKNEYNDLGQLLW